MRIDKDIKDWALGKKFYRPHNTKLFYTKDEAIDYLIKQRWSDSRVIVSLLTNENVCDTLYEQGFYNYESFVKHINKGEMLDGNR